jgi:hypothetical protein
MPAETFGICGSRRSKNREGAENASRHPLSATLSRDLIVPVKHDRAGGTNDHMANTRTTRKAACEDCFFRCNLLCALDLDEPCATFRPNGPDGLRPPQQLRFAFRQERRTQSAWAFPTAQEQAALHAR